MDILESFYKFFTYLNATWKNKNVKQPDRIWYNNYVSLFFVKNFVSKTCKNARTIGKKFYGKSYIITNKYKSCHKKSSKKWGMQQKVK